MLRATVLALGGLCCAGAALGLLLGAGGGMLGLLAFGLLILGGTLFERRYHRNLTAPPGPGWERTQEVFQDPSSGELLEVWYNPITGQRRYVSRK
ncbi:hypothetical protein [Acidocella sp.]|uniref:hypothetical protein n=1 Tax=Acidocella sp. TaxID=50710 RepID=UPI002601B3C6|nr:hypothetical protein [Acidocella sp.]